MNVIEVDSIANPKEIKIGIEIEVETEVEIEVGTVLENLGGGAILPVLMKRKNRDRSRLGSLS